MFMSRTIDTANNNGREKFKGAKIRLGPLAWCLTQSFSLGGDKTISTLIEVQNEVGTRMEPRAEAKVQAL